jgi:hypothetical protein
MIVAMMTNELQVSILAAPLAQMDRRALSQAWYTALRLAPNAQIASQRSAPAQLAPVPNIADRFAEKRELPRRMGPASYGATLPSAHRVANGFDGMQGATREARRRTLAERIARAFAGAERTAKRATFSLGRGNARVHVVLQTIGERPTLLALCRPEVQPVVRRALTQARLALARRGIGVELCALGELGF